LNKVLGFRFSFRLFHVGHWIFPALRDPARRDGLLDIEYLAVMLDIGYFPPCGIPQGGTGYWILKVLGFRFQVLGFRFQVSGFNSGFFMLDIP